MATTVACFNIKNPFYGSERAYDHVGIAGKPDALRRPAMSRLPKGFVDKCKPLAIGIHSSGASDFICPPFDTPQGPNGVIFSASEGR
jgi:hypothetical protein